MLKLRIPMGVFFAGDLDALTPGTISIEVPVASYGDDAWWSHLNRRLGLVEAFRLPGRNRQYASHLRLVIWHQTGAVDPVVLGGRKGTVPSAGFLDFEWAMRLERHDDDGADSLGRIFVRDMVTLLRLVGRGGTVRRLLRMDTLGSLPWDAAVGLMVREWGCPERGTATS